MISRSWGKESLTSRRNRRFENPCADLKDKKSRVERLRRLRVGLLELCEQLQIDSTSMNVTSDAFSVQAAHEPSHQSLFPPPPSASSASVPAPPDDHESARCGWIIST
jgi:hypothetical protein